MFFATTIGTPIEAAAVARAFHRALARGRVCRIGTSTTSAMPAGPGLLLEEVNNLLGHSSIVLTSNTHGHVLEQRQQQVARGMDAVIGG